MGVVPMFIFRSIVNRLHVFRSPSLFPSTTLALVAVLASGCATGDKDWMKRKDVTALCAGRTRAEVLKQFGPPQTTTTSKQGTLIDTFRFLEDALHGEEDGDSVEMQSVRQLAITHDPLVGKLLSVRVDYDLREVITDTYLISITKPARIKATAAKVQ